MANGWLKFLVPKVWVKVESLADVTRMRASQVKIYGIRCVEDGYIVSVRRDAAHHLPIVGRQSIYGFLLSFVLPVVLVWGLLLMAVEWVTIDYEIRGNLSPEDVLLVDQQMEAHFIYIGPFAFLRSDHQALTHALHTIFHDYIWIDVERHGSRLVIDIFDTQMMAADSASEHVDTIYARVSGEITDIEVTGCLVLVEPYQVVRKGEPLISCYTPTGFGTEMTPIASKASGSIYANVWYEVKIEFPREYGVSMVTNNSKSVWFLNLGNSSIHVWGDQVDFEDFETRSRVFNPLALFNVSPISLEQVHYYEKSDIMLSNEIEQIRATSDRLVKTQLAALIEGDFEVVNLEFLMLDESDELVRLIYHATVREDIAR